MRNNTYVGNICLRVPKVYRNIYLMVRACLSRVISFDRRLNLAAVMRYHSSIISFYSLTFLISQCNITQLGKHPYVIVDRTDLNFDF